MHDLGPAARELARVVDRVRDDDLDRPTPCGSWTVRDLLVHLLALSAHFATVARHTSPEQDSPTDLPSDWRDRLDARLADLPVAWSGPGAWEGTGSAGGATMPRAELGVVALHEVVLHGWDLARSIGAGYEVRDEDVAAVGAFVTAFEHADQEARAGLYGPVVDAATRSGLDRVLALAGRDPHRPLAAASG